MNFHSRVLAASFLVAMLSACNPGASVSSDRGSVKATGDRITLKADGHPQGVITADGSLSIDGVEVAVTDEQRILLRTYHSELNGMTEDGIAIGKQGAALAGKAVKAAIHGALRGESDKAGEAIEADARKMEQEALKICRRLLVVKDAQDQLSASLPAFAPYATIRLDDIGECTGSGEGAEANPGAPAAEPAGGPSPDASDEAAAATSEAVKT